MGLFLLTGTERVNVNDLAVFQVYSSEVKVRTFLVEQDFDPVRSVSAPEQTHIPSPRLLFPCLSLSNSLFWSFILEHVTGAQDMGPALLEFMWGGPQE